MKITSGAGDPLAPDVPEPTTITHSNRNEDIMAIHPAGIALHAATPDGGMGAWWLVVGWTDDLDPVVVPINGNTPLDGMHPRILPAHKIAGWEVGACKSS